MAFSIKRFFFNQENIDPRVILSFQFLRIKLSSTHRQYALYFAYIDELFGTH